MLCDIRCLYNALNDRIRNLLLQYDYSKSTDPLQPFAAHLSSFLAREHPKTSDIVVDAADETFHLHKFVLSARSPYFRQKLSANPETTSWNLPSTIPPQAFGACIRYLYLGEAPRELRSGPGTGFTEAEILTGIDRIGGQLELGGLLESIVDSGDRRLARQRRSEEVAKGRDQMETWFRENVLRQKVVVDTDKAKEVQWDHTNGVFADVLLQADEFPEDLNEEDAQRKDEEDGNSGGIPVGPSLTSRTQSTRKSVLYPVHKAMLLRSEFFLAMFSSAFREAQASEYLHIINVDCAPEILEIILTYLYTEKADFSLDVAVDVLFAADLLLIERLKTKAGVVISTLGNGNMEKPKPAQPSRKGTPGGPKTSDQEGQTEVPKKDDEDKEEEEEEPVDIYEIMRAAWLTRVQRLEEFVARYLAYRLESHIDLPDFEQLVLESATRIQKRQETDSIELIDDIRYYLGERFRLRFEDTGLEEMLEENTQQIEEVKNDVVNIAQVNPPSKESDIPNWSSESASPIKSKTLEDEGVDVSGDEARKNGPVQSNLAVDSEHGDGAIRTLDGEAAGDEFYRDAKNYQILLNKLDTLLGKLGLEA